MITKPVNILLIGFGPHAKRVYYPIYKRDGDYYNFRIAYAVDLETKRNDIEFYLKNDADCTTPVYFISPNDIIPGKLSPQVQQNLDEIVQTHQIRGIILLLNL